jgi:hypothetical protein
VCMSSSTLLDIVCIFRCAMAVSLFCSFSLSHAIVYCADE